MCARPSAPPPSRATPILARGRFSCADATAGWFAEFSCAAVNRGNRKTTDIRRRTREARNMKPPDCVPEHEMRAARGGPSLLAIAGQVHSVQMGTSDAALVFLKKISAIHHQRLPGDIGCVRGREEAD